MPSPSSGSPAGTASIRTWPWSVPPPPARPACPRRCCTAGAITTPGSLERGTTVSDFDPLERRMQHSLNAAVMHCTHGGSRIHLIDTPGSADFVGHSLPALEAVETAAVVISAVTGIEPMAGA